MNKALGLDEVELVRVVMCHRELKGSCCANRGEVRSTIAKAFYFARKWWNDVEMGASTATEAPSNDCTKVLESSSEPARGKLDAVREMLKKLSVLQFLTKFLREGVWTEINQSFTQ